MVDPSVPPLLPPEDLASQLSTIEVLLSIYNGSSDLNSISLNDAGGNEGDDVILSAESYKAIQDLAHFLSLPLEALGKPPSTALRDGIPGIIQLGIKLDPLRGTLTEDRLKDNGKQVSRHLILNVGIVIRRLGKVDEGSKNDLLKPRWHLNHADWLDRPSYETLCDAAKSIEWEDESVGYVMNIIEAISEESLDYLSNTNTRASTSEGASNTKSDFIQGDERSADPNSEMRVVRTWHLFPSLSMKDKRKDLVTYAERYNLTGFVLAGKPGLVVLEHSMQGNTTADDCIKVIDSYWSDIKTTSWSDLPPGHKKVSERHREVGVSRCFVEIQDVTSLEEISESSQIIENGRVRRNDLDKIKIWLQSRGCTGQLDIVLGKE